MKKFIYLNLLVLFCVIQIAQAQVPQAFNYQGVARNSAGQPLSAGTTVGIQFVIREGSPTGQAIYTENHTTQIGDLGMFSLRIGTGTPVTGSFITLDWGGAPKFVTIRFDPNGGTNFIDMGTTPLLSVPYALHAENGNWDKNGIHIQKSNMGSVLIKETGGNTAGNDTGAVNIFLNNTLRPALKITDITGFQPTHNAFEINRNFTGNFAPNEAGAQRIATDSANGLVIRINKGTLHSGLDVANPKGIAGKFSNNNNSASTIEIKNEATSGYALKIPKGTVNIGNPSVFNNGILTINDSTINAQFATALKAIGRFTGVDGFGSSKGVSGASEAGVGVSGYSFSGIGVFGSSVSDTHAGGYFENISSSPTPGPALVTGPGNVGFNISNPTAQLHVGGKTKIDVAANDTALIIGNGSIRIGQLDPNYTGTFVAVDTLSTNSLSGIATGTFVGKFSGLNTYGSNTGITARSRIGFGVYAISEEGKGIYAANYSAGNPTAVFEQFGSLQGLRGPSLVALGGNVGIGTNTPSALLTVEGSMKLGSSTNGNGMPSSGAGTLRFNNANNTFEGWNGTAWMPFNGSVGGGTGDNWGTQVAITNASVAGNGTASAPLGLAQQGATNGQTLKWNGLNWLPANDNDAQTLTVLSSLSGTSLSIANGNTVTLPWGFDNSNLVYNGNGNVAIGSGAAPQKLTVAGAIQIGSTAMNTDGTIRYTGTDFQGRLNGNWVSLTGTSSTTLNGDVTGNLSANTVTKIQNRAVAATAPTAGQALAWNAITTQWEPTTLGGGGGGGQWATTGNNIYNNNTGTVMLGTSTSIAGGLEYKAEILAPSGTMKNGMLIQVPAGNSMSDGLVVRHLNAGSGNDAIEVTAIGGNAISASSTSGSALYARTTGANTNTADLSTTGAGSTAVLLNASGNNGVALEVANGKVIDYSGKWTYKTPLMNTGSTTYLIPTALSNNVDDLVFITPQGGSVVNNVQFIVKWNGSQWQIATKDGTFFENNLLFNVMVIHPY